jgi:pimeloyl-ACP methyl ester carboxylesterase
MFKRIARLAMGVSLALTITAGVVAPAGAATSYKTVKVDGLSIFYREAGPPNAPVLLLLHGFPSSSRMYEPLLNRLAGQYHLIAPDYPGFGHSDAPDAKSFQYTFDHIASVMTHFTEAVGASRYILYLEDYGGPVGFRLAIAHPERVQGLIIQNAVAHEDGLGPIWEARRAFWRDRGENETAFRKSFLSVEAAQKRHVGSSPNFANYDPDRWTDEFAFLSRPGESDIQTDLFYDYRTNEPSFPAWQAWMKKAQPKTLVVWGRYDQSFEAAEAIAYKRELPKAGVYVIDAGHFALDERPDDVAALICKVFAQNDTR